ncbi:MULTISPECIES: uridine kinase [Prochlorococcus]|uniref:Phosphoribulokinase/uridine kinase family enzyme n=1 Tax=Prochlorococcus marinus (strain SARG / CCMP1375 / SS120) TaxID=167539 RepID=Q7VCL0_PROMA|nr:MULTISPECIES: uridine kinase [Prochlorococcus]AAP99774.1 Phosphoribulokinase/uridine kinase family enzyme [Prochlorococcus marinus subsp. marinus str. CCMP1375]KGG12749.1 D-glycerate 3-kinase [Prochlorococcus marinus str. LG]KGG22476.1 D-glycerate 3-kinase [Prochlorococcus marinus str. SS2]KGG23781.1 D-glycerate 3-kinase [Prochlorococcus marinus str. SS35]KGG32006.1 D-glycerate 3-kinase [Prochlorococcus marinus str. SS51]
MSDNFSNKSNLNKNISPWLDPKHSDILFPFANLQSLLNDLGWESDEWINYWLAKDGYNLAASFWAKGTKLDWLWGLGLPFLTDIKRFAKINNARKVYGISALPGCGKTSFGKWIEAAAKELDISIKVLSLDDFYLPGSELEKAMKDNPWNVPRGLPGSHSINLLENVIDKWISTGSLKAPQFDKSLRKGLGDRSGWTNSSPDVLVLEGWFLGCTPLKSSLNFNGKDDVLSPKLTIFESDYRLKVQELIKDYLPIWQRINRIWHLKANDFSSTCKWKVDQEKEMLVSKGSALQGELLSSFVRMIEASIPQESLMNIDCNVVVEINNLREILNILPSRRQF